LSRRRRHHDQFALCGMVFPRSRRSSAARCGGAAWGTIADCGFCDPLSALPRTRSGMRSACPLFRHSSRDRAGAPQFKPRPTWHVHEWLWHDPSKSTKTTYKTIIAFRAHILRTCPELAWLRDVTNGSKHCALDRKPTLAGTSGTGLHHTGEITDPLGSRPVMQTPFADPMEGTEAGLQMGGSPVL
jgi:hypothetical protein